MKGSYSVTIKNAVVRYDFVIRRNITIIKGDSATGKTTLVEMVGEYYESGEASGIWLNCDRICMTLSGRDWKKNLDGTQERIIFIDEGNDFVLSNDFAAAVRNSDNYFVIVTREGLPNLPYSVEEIYGIRESGKYAALKQIYNEFYRIYGREDYTKAVEPEKVIVEDSNAGYEFYNGISGKNGWTASCAGGKSNIFAEVLKCKSENILVIADGAAFGAEMSRMVQLMENKKGVILYLPESFEWLILKSGIIRDKDLKVILDHPQEYIDSREYFSWERFFTRLLVDKTKNSHLKYTKKELNPVYFHNGYPERICEVMKPIQLLNGHDLSYRPNYNE